MTTQGHRSLPTWMDSEHQRTSRGVETTTAQRLPLKGRAQRGALQTGPAQPGPEEWGAGRRSTPPGLGQQCPVGPPFTFGVREPCHLQPIPVCRSRGEPSAPDVGCPVPSLLPWGPPHASLAVCAVPVCDSPSHGLSGLLTRGPRCTSVLAEAHGVSPAWRVPRGDAC